MPAPNLITLTDVVGKTHAEFISDTSQIILQNATGSSEILRVNVMYVTNVSMNSATVTIELNRNNINYKLIYNLLVNANSSVVPIAKDSSIYLEEGDSLKIFSNLAGVLHFVISYDVMS